MNYIEWVFQHPVSAFFLLLAEYIIIMVLYHKTNKVGAKIAKVLAVFFIPQDFIANVIVMTMLSAVLLEFEWPQETLVTSRLQRWKTLDDDTRRSKFAWPMCRFLNKFDAGHC